MPQGLAVTPMTIRRPFGLVKTQTQHVRCPGPSERYMWVHYLWITLRESWAQAGQGLGTTVENALLELVDERERERFVGKLAHSRIGRGFLHLDASSGRPDPGRDLLALAVGVLEHRHRALQLVLEHV